MLDSNELFRASGLDEIPHPSAMSVDLGRLRRLPPLEALRHLVGLRMMGIGAQFEHGDREGDKGPHDYLTYRLLTPVNPLLLLSAISISLERGSDFRGFLLRYAQALEVNGLEDALIRLPPALTGDDELARVLQTEALLASAMLDWAREVVLQHGTLIEARGQPTQWDLYWACWVIANPLYKYDLFPAKQAEERLKEARQKPILAKMRRWAERLFRGQDGAGQSKAGELPFSPWHNGWLRSLMWGHEFNQDIVRAFDYYHRIAEKQLAAIETLEKHPKTSAEELTVRKAAADVAVRLAQRAYRLYQWPRMRSRRTRSKN